MGLKATKQCHKVHFDYFSGDNIVYKPFSVVGCAFEKTLPLSAERNLTDNLLFLTVLKRFDVMLESVSLDMLHSLGRSLSPLLI